MCLILCVLGCQSEVSTKDTAVYVPLAPDYSNPIMWHIVQNDQGDGADVFYIPSTWEFDWCTADSVVSHYADPWNVKHRDNMNIEMTEVAKYMADGNRFYSPYYRHITLDSWATLNEDTINRRFHDVAFVDIQLAFDHYQKYYNQGRPFVLAGFSQGGKSVVELMKVMPEEIRKRMVAAYVLGYKLTPDDVNQAPWLKAAQDSTDTGVIICYNSVSDVKYVKPIVCLPNVMCINPVNWRTDGEVATAAQHRGSRFFNYKSGKESDHKNFVTARIDTKNGALLVIPEKSGKYDSRAFGKGIYHGYELQFFYHDLKENGKLTGFTGLE